MLQSYCHHMIRVVSDSCECEYQIVSPSEVPRGTRLAKANAAAITSKLKTRANSEADSKPKTSGCAGIFLCLFGTVVLMYELLQ